MERAYSHSRPPAFSSKKKPPPFSSSSSSSFHNNGGFFTTSYDDVFGGPPKFASSSSLAPRAEDYSEIFGGFRLSSSSSSRSSSSIPVLDLPAVPDDIHSAAAFFDYSEVFGGFNAVDFAVPFDELFRPCDDSFYDDDGDGGGSSDEAWTPAGSDSLSDDSDPFAFTEEKSELSIGTSHQQSESKQFNVSYHKINPRTSTYMPNTMHVTQLNDVPGYTCVVDEAIGRDICSPVVDDIVLSVGSPSHITQKHTTKSMSHASYDDIGSKSCDSDRRSGKSCSARTSHTSSTFASVSDINLRTEPSHLPPPSRPPPVLADRSEDINELISGPLASEKCGVEATIDGSLPPVFDMEVDASSSAAVSAAAMKDAMEKAQAKLKAAKDQRQRKERIQNSEKQHIETDKNCGKNTQVVCDESFTIEARVPTTSDGGPSKMKIHAKAGHAKNASQNLPDILAAEQFTGVSEKPAGTKQVKKSSLSMDTVFTDADCQWKEARQYYEFVNSDNTWLEPQLHSSNGDAKTIIKQQGDDGHNSDSSGEACVTVENRRRLKATKVISRQEYYEKMVKVAQEVHDSVTCGHVEPEKRLNDKSPGNLKQQKPESIYEPKKPEIPLCESHKMENPSASVWKEEAGKRSKKVPTKEENKEESEYSGLCDINAVGLHGSMVKEASIIKQELRKSSESERCKGDHQVQETVETEGHEQKAEEFCEKPRTESTVAVSPKQKRNKDTKEVVDKRSKGSSKEVLSGDSMQSARESEEKEKMKDLKRMKAADKRLKEAFVDVSSRKEMLPCEKQENNKRTTLQQREEVEIHLTEAVHGKESKKMLEKCTEMEKSQKNKEVPKEAIGSQRLYGVHNLIVDDKCSEEGQKQYNKTEKLEKTTDLEHKSLQACKLEKVYCKLEEAAEEQRFKTKLEKCVILENCENNIEVPKPATRLQKLDEARNLIVENSNSEEIQKQDSSKERLEMATEPKHKPLQTCDLKKTRKSDENTDDKEDQNGAYKHHIKIQQDEGQGRTSFPDIELPIEDNNLKSSKWTNLHKDAELDLFCKLEKADDFNELTAQKDIGDIGSTLSDEISNLETVKTAEVLIDERQTEPDVTQVSHKDSELDARTFRASDTLAPDEDNITTGGACSRNEQNPKEEKRKVAQSTPDPSLVKNFNNEVGGKRNLMGECPVLFEHEEKVRYTQGINGFTEHVSREEVTHTVQPEGKGSFQKTSHPPNFGPSIERKGRIDHNCLSEEKDGDRERDLEKERLQKLEEERERLREREKDRMAVEIAVHEARDRAYADARDRAERAALERATDDARQRAMAEARERLEKACAEARERSLADKAEARLKAERAAVERATAEARQRAIEKAMADRTTFDARDRMQRSVSEKYLSEREVMMRQSSFPMSSERFEAANSEPAQRCKARLERHRRTVERVAKALAEKNMRDLLAQREQAERTRLAETLDADIRRWSSGKEGNLRALLSTLQYILGPDSGWHPIPLTEVITAAAVKKAYRKATLCVHPDKLQQRGASVQQKYICEKVFDLLKEAWNRFNSEEK